MRQSGRARPWIVVVLVATMGACAPIDEPERTIWHAPQDGIVAARGAAEPVPRATHPPQLPQVQAASLTRSAPPGDWPTASRDKGLEVLVRAEGLEIGWTDEAVEAVEAWPSPAGQLGAPLPALVQAAAAYAAREEAAAAKGPGHDFDRFARVRIEPGALPTTEHLDGVLASLKSAGFARVALMVGRERLELRLPAAPRPPEVAAGQGAGLGFARLRWGQGQEGVWIDGDVALSEPQRAAEAPPGTRPDLPVGLRSAWSCALVQPEPTFEDAVRRATSALTSFDLPPDLPVYVELAPGASFRQAWQLAREVRGSGHEQVSFTRGASTPPIPARCPAEVGNVAALRAAAPHFEAQAPREDEHVGAALDFFGLVDTH